MAKNHFQKIFFCDRLSKKEKEPEKQNTLLFKSFEDTARFAFVSIFAYQPKWHNKCTISRRIRFLTNCK